MGDFERTVREFKRTLTWGRQKTAPLDIMGKVTRVEDGVAWVRFAGSEVGDTPVRMNIDCKEGDDVQVRSSDGKAWIVGNQSAPPTDDSKAKEVEKKTEKFAERIKSVEKVAGDAEEVANAVNQKVWSDEAGLHIADGKQDAAAERNTIWNSLGMLFRKGLNPILGILTGDNPRVAIYDGQGSGEEHEVASFGSTARIGGNSEYAAVVGAGRFGIESGDNVSLFDISPSGNPTSDIYTVRKDIPPNTKTYTLEHTPINGTSIQCNYAYDEKSGQGVPVGIGKIMFTAGSFGTKTKTERGTTVTITYSSPQTFTMSVSYSLGNEGFRFFSYKIPGESVDLGILTFGTRRDGSTFGNNSATIGNDLLASHNYQTVVGKSNKEYNGPFVVGNGDAGSYSSAFAVDWYGNVKAKGDIYVNCNSDSSGGIRLSPLVAEWHNLDNQTIAKSAIGEVRVPIAKSGYTPIGVIGWDIDGGSSNASNNNISSLVPLAMRLIVQNNTTYGYAQLRNNSTSPAYVNMRFHVLYMAN